MKVAPGASVPGCVRCVRERPSEIGMHRTGSTNKHDSIENTAAGGFLKPASFPRPGRRATIRKDLPGQCRTASCRLRSRPDGLVCRSNLSASKTNRLGPAERTHETLLGFEATGKRSAD